MEVTRQQLYDEIWQEPTTKVAKKYGISDVALAKTCKKHHIPKPPLGYWAKLAHGKNVMRTPLPKQNDPALETIWFRPRRHGSTRPPLGPEVKAKIAAEQSEEFKVVVADHLESPHPLVERTERSLRSASTDNSGIIYPKAKGCLDVAVSKCCIDRTMRILDALIKAAEARGIVVRVEDEEYKRTTVFEVDGEQMGLRLVERLGERPRQPTPDEKRDERNYPTLYANRKYTESFLSGELTLSIAIEFRYDRRRWMDKEGKLENRLNTVLAFMFRSAATVKEKQKQHEEMQRQWDEERRVREEAEKRRLEERQRIRDLNVEVAKWSRAERIRAYVAAAEAAATQRHGSINSDDDLGQWINWAKRRADRIDPLRSKSSRRERRSSN